MNRVARFPPRQKQQRSQKSATKRKAHNPDENLLALRFERRAAYA